MSGTLRKYFPAIVCAALPIACYCMVRPFAEIGILDDWAYVKDAWTVAQTGHISYTGPETPMLGWQLYFGALFIKLFGFSFTAVRFSTLVEAVSIAFLLERIGERSGLNARNAALLTAIFVLSPLFLPISFTFMSDVPGILCVIMCLYMCLRALQAESDKAAVAWVTVAPLLNAVGGTARQIDWLGLLVMVPSTLWLLRRNRRTVVAGALSCAAGLVFVVAAMHWLRKQPYFNPVSPLDHAFDFAFLKSCGRVALGSVGVLTLYALPILLLFALPLSTRKRWGAGMAAFLFVIPIQLLKIDKWPINGVFNGMTFRSYGRLSTIAQQSTHAAGALDPLRILLTAAAVLGLLFFVLSLIECQPLFRASREQKATLSWQQLGVILGPFSAAYLLFVTIAFVMYDRYFLPLLAVLLLVLVRFYQDYIQARLSWKCILPMALFAAFSVVAAHDEFAANRGMKAAADELRSSGVPATAILGPQALEGWAELEKTGHLGKAQPAGGSGPSSAGDAVPTQCNKDLYFLLRLGETPSMRPVYAVSFNPHECGGRPVLAPVPVRTWITPRMNWIHPVRLPPSLQYETPASGQ